MPDKVFLPMETNQRDELRYAMETQFRYKFYNQTEFPFLPVMGIRHIFQSFEAPDELGYIGMLHLWWTMEDNGIVYDNPRNFVKGTWHGEWFDTPMQGIEKASEVYQQSQGEKLIQIHRNYQNDAQNKKTQDDIQKHLREEEHQQMDDSIPDKKILLN